MSEVKYNPGDIVELGGIKFVVLNNDYDGKGHLFILTLEAQGENPFGADNNYKESNLRTAVDEWYSNFVDHVISPRFPTRFTKCRELDLTTLDGHGHYGVLYTASAPLTLDEARKYADVIPPCDSPWWLATGWGGPGYYGSALALFVDANGDWGHYYCSYSYGIRPALVIDPVLLDKDEAPDQNMPQIPDLSGCSTDDLLAEIKRRMELE